MAPLKLPKKEQVSACLGYKERWWNRTKIHPTWF